MKQSQKQKIKNALDLHINSVTDEQGNYLPVDIFIDIDTWTDLVEDYITKTLERKIETKFGNQISVKINSQTTIHINTYYRKL